MRINAWYAVGNAQLKKNARIILGVTHHRLPVNLDTKGDSNNVEEHLEQAFATFNWVHRDFIAPTWINKFARLIDSHASMSVGDVLEVENGSYWMCDSFGWKPIKPEIAL